MTIYIRPDGTISDKESGLDFEDQREIRKRLPNDAWGRDSFDLKYNPDTIIENVDVETEVVWQFRYLYPHSNIWHDTTKTRGGRYMLEKEYRTVLRIKDKP